MPPHTIDRNNSINKIAKLQENKTMLQKNRTLVSEVIKIYIQENKENKTNCVEGIS